jgi:hypothetical protein
VDADPFTDEMVAPVLGEVAVADERLEPEDGLSAVQASASWLRPNFESGR